MRPAAERPWSREPGQRRVGRAGHRGDRGYRHPGAAADRLPSDHRDRPGRRHGRGRGCPAARAGGHGDRGERRHGRGCGGDTGRPRTGGEPDRHDRPARRPAAPGRADRRGRRFRPVRHRRDCGPRGATARAAGVPRPRPGRPDRAGADRTRRRARPLVDRASTRTGSPSSRPCLGSPRSPLYAGSIPLPLASRWPRAGSATRPTTGRCCSTRSARGWASTTCPSSSQP